MHLPLQIGDIWSCFLYRDRIVLHENRNINSDASIYVPNIFPVRYFFLSVLHVISEIVVVPSSTQTWTRFAEIQLQALGHPLLLNEVMAWELLYHLHLHSEVVWYIRDQGATLDQGAMGLETDSFVFHFLGKKFKEPFQKLLRRCRGIGCS